jgi:hypothetical protein
MVCREPYEIITCSAFLWTVGIASLVLNNAPELLIWTFTLNNNNNIYLLQMGCHPVAVITLYVFSNTATKLT